jgi:DNA-directed RNA polymerase subunit omega
MAWRHDTMMNPPIEELFDRADSKFRLVTLASKRARQINSYFNQLGEGLGATVPPQVTSVARKPLSIAFEEIAADKIIPVEPQVPTEEELIEVEAAEIEAAEAVVLAEAAEEVLVSDGQDEPGIDPSA